MGKSDFFFLGLFFKGGSIGGTPPMSASQAVKIPSFSNSASFADEIF